MNDSPAPARAATKARQATADDIPNSAVSTAAGAETARPAAPLVIPHSSMKLHEFSNNFFKVILPRGCTHENLKDSNLWANVAHEFKAHDEILAVSPDGKWVAKLLVADAVPQCALVVVLQVIPLPDRLGNYEAGVPLGYVIRPAELDECDLGGWIIIRSADNVVVGRGLPTYEEARRHLLDHASLKVDAPTRYLP